ncbi:MAG: hypothetical protein QOH96_99 [Blastocatellia bacterium]|nr:hypothetical protein [Blastocatellia bacterium]
MYSVTLSGGAFFEVIVLFDQAPGFSMASHEISIDASQAIFDLASELKFSNQRHRHRPHTREHHANHHDRETADSCMRRACNRCVPSPTKDKQEQHRLQEKIYSSKGRKLWRAAASPGFQISVPLPPSPHVPKKDASNHKKRSGYFSPIFLHC